MTATSQNPQSDTDDRLSLAVFVKLIRAAEAVSATVHGPLAREPLSISQFGVLEALYHLGPMCQKELAGKILKSTGNITMVLDNLEKRSLVRRIRSTVDRRFVTVEMTAGGAALMERIFPPHVERIKRRMTALDRRELETLGRLLKKLGCGAGSCPVEKGPLFLEGTAGTSVNCLNGE